MEPCHNTINKKKISKMKRNINRDTFWLKAICLYKGTYNINKLTLIQIILLLSNLLYSNSSLPLPHLIYKNDYIYQFYWSTYIYINFIKIRDKCNKKHSTQATKNILQPRIRP